MWCDPDPARLDLFRGTTVTRRVYVLRIRGQPAGSAIRASCHQNRLRSVYHTSALHHKDVRGLQSLNACSADHTQCRDRTDMVLSESQPTPSYWPCKRKSTKCQRSRTVGGRTRCALSPPRQAQTDASWPCHRTYFSGLGHTSDRLLWPNDKHQAAGTGQCRHWQPTLPPLACMLWFADLLAQPCVTSPARFEKSRRARSPSFMNTYNGSASLIFRFICELESS
jgi:hypothetical protein